MPDTEHTTTWFRRASSSRPLMIVLAAVVVVAVVGSTIGYSALSKSVTLTLDGESEQVTAFGGTVGDVLADQGIEIGDKDEVAPSLDAQIDDGTRISVHFARPLEVNLDGEPTTYWTTATTVNAALDDIGVRAAGAELSASRGGSIDRDGMSLDVVTAKDLRIKVGDRKPVDRTITALTVEDALQELGVEVGPRDEIKPAVDHVLEDGDRLVFTDVRVVTRDVKGETVPFDTVEREDGSMFEGESEVVTAGRAGVRDVTYRIVYRNGEVVVRKVVRQDVKRKPVAEVVNVGTKQDAPNFAGGNTVWDSLAKCESGGNWAINTGNGYYGGLQFSLGTWRAYGGPGMPHQQSRETQIAIATKVRNAAGGYGAWPGCAAKLGLPR